MIPAVVLMMSRSGMTQCTTTLAGPAAPATEGRGASSINSRSSPLSPQCPSPTNS